jgi:hypothetical protein
LFSKGTVWSYVPISNVQNGFLFCFIWDRVSLSSPGCPHILHSPASTSSGRITDVPHHTLLQNSF